MTPTKTVLTAAKTLTHPRFEQFCRRFLHLTQDQLKQGLDDKTQILIYLLEWLIHLGLFSDADQEIIISTYREQLVKCLNVWKGETKAAMTTFGLTVCDGKYVGWTGEEKFLEVSSGDKLEELPRTPVTLVVCNVTELFNRKKEYILAMEQENERQHTHGIDPDRPTTNT